LRRKTSTGKEILQHKLLLHDVIQGDYLQSELKHSLSPMCKHCIDCHVSCCVSCSHTGNAFLYSELSIPVLQEILKMFPIGLVMFFMPSKQIMAHMLLLFYGYTEHFNLSFFCQFFCVWIYLVDYILNIPTRIGHTVMSGEQIGHEPWLVTFSSCTLFKVYTVYFAVYAVTHSCWTCPWSFPLPAFCLQNSCSMYITYLSELVSSAYRASYPPHTWNEPNTHFYIMEWNFLYKIFIFCT
jgi:hypothetical protein